MDRQSKRRIPSAGSAGKKGGRRIQATASRLHKAEAAEGNSKRKRRAKRARRAARNENAVNKAFPWRKLLLGAGIAAALLIVLSLIFGSDPKVYHQLPTVTPPEAADVGEDSP